MFTKYLPTPTKASLRFLFALALVLTLPGQLSAQDPPPLLAPPPIPSIQPDAPVAPSAADQPAINWEPIDAPYGAPPPSSPDPIAVPPPNAEPDIPAASPPQADLIDPVPDQYAGPNLEKDPSSTEVWRPQSEFPQIPLPLAGHFDTSWVADGNPVKIFLQFDPRTAGKMVIVRPDDGVSIDPPETEFTIGATGELIVTFSLADGYNHSAISIIVDGHRSIMPIARTTLPIVIQKEEETGGAE